MMTTVRTSKRIALGGLFAVAFLILCLLALKDLNDKLNVMTASNSGYQQMTDAQGDKIKTLTSELEVLRVSKMAELKAIQEEAKVQEKKFLELKDKFNALNLQNNRCSGQLNDMLEQKSKLEKLESECKRGSARQKSEAEHLSVQLRDQIARISMDRDACRRQYDALFKLHQAASDDVVSLNQDKERLSLQLTDVTDKQKSSTLTSDKVNKIQIQIPNNSRSSSIQPIGLEQPHKISTSSRLGKFLQFLLTKKRPLFKSRSSLYFVGMMQVQEPVQVVPIHQVRKEDVMEAPKHWKNLDAQVDPHEQDHPGLQAPVYQDDDAEIEDSADGQLPLEYLKNNQRYDIDYDFQADFQQRKPIPAVPRPLVPHQVLDTRHQQRILAHRQPLNRGL